MLLSGSQSSKPKFDNLEDCVQLMESRAAIIVGDVAQRMQRKEPLEADVNQKVSKAVAEAFVATQILEMLNQLRASKMGKSEQEQVGKLYLLASTLSFCRSCYKSTDSS